MEKNHKNNFIAVNIKYLRSEKNLQQDEFAGLFNVSRDVIGTYERGKAVPKVEVMQMICEYFKISIDDFINKDLSKQKIIPGDYMRDPVIAQLAQEPAGSFESAGWVGIVESQRQTIETQAEMIEILKKEIRRLSGDQDYKSKAR